MNQIIVLFTAAGLILFSQIASAQSNLDLSTAEHDNCHDVSGKLVERYDASQKTAFGTLRNAGWLDGTTAFTDSSAAFPTADLNKVSFSSAVTLTTAHGQLKGKGLVLFDVITGIGTSVSEFDGSTSTGIFAGATGVLFVNTFRADTVAQGPYYSVVQGRICLAHGKDRPDR